MVLSDGDGNFKSVRVTLGQSDSTHFEVVEGLLPEDDMVVSAQFLIDSESSKSSDFKRMKAPDHQATTTGTIEAIELPADTEKKGASNNAKLVKCHFRYQSILTYLSSKKVTTSCSPS